MPIERTVGGVAEMKCPFCDFGLNHVDIERMGAHIQHHDPVKLGQYIAERQVRKR